RWTDAKGDRWPVAWRIDIPSADLRIRTSAVFDNQHWQRSVDYWEGMIDVYDQSSDERIGRGYLELSGYGED
ncbi:MAG: lipocalin family protein, partial [Xanthomonadaceae bacterium]|nr:lipocalin family protein [Xanthomonadaceae bacterium]